MCQSPISVPILPIAIFSGLIIALSYNSALGQATPRMEAFAVGAETRSAIDEDCYAAIGPLLEMDEGELTPEVRKAYLDWAEATVLRELRQGNQTVPEDCLDEVRADATLHDAMFGAVYPPDPSILQNYAHLRAEMGAEFIEKYRSLAVAVAVAKRIKGVESNQDLGVSGNSTPFAASGSKDFGRNYQPEFWVDESLQVIRTQDEKEMVASIADFMKTNQVAALELYQNASRQLQLAAFLKEHHVAPSLLGQINQSVQFGEWLKNAMVLLGQRPAAREEKPDTATWLRYLVSIYEATPSSTPTLEGRVMSWPLFPIDKAPWPLLMPLARPVPLGEAKYIWETFQGEHGTDRYHTYGPFLDAAAAMAYELQPSPWFWDAWPDRIVHGGECVPISKGTVDLYSCLDKPAVWAGQPGHANLISFQFVDGAWTAEIEQAFAGGPSVTFAQWYFDEDTGTGLRFRSLYDWAGAEYHLGLALGMNSELQSYMDTRLAANIFKVLPAKEKQTLGVTLLRNALKTNPYNPEIWYRLAQQMPDAMEGMTLAQSAIAHSPDRLGYWQTVEEFVTRYSILALPAPQDEVDARSVYKFLESVPGILPDDLVSYADKFHKTEGQDLQADAVKYDQDSSDQGDAFGQLRMGERYLDGEGVPEDETKAMELLAKSAAQGDNVAALTLDQLEPSILIPANVITVTASSVFSSGQDVQHLVDGSGMQGTFHDNNGSAFTMWQSAKNPTPESPADGLAPSPAWVRFDFAKPQKFEAILIWNHNQPNLTDRGFRKTRICGSSDGVTWFPLTSPETVELPRANGSVLAQAATVENIAAGRLIKSVIIAADFEDGNYGSDYFGLSAVRFVLEKLSPTIPASLIAVTASSVFSPGQEVRHLVDGSGMQGAAHDNNYGAFTMWQSVRNPKPEPPADALVPSPAWVRFDFAQPQKFDEILIWNHNQVNLTDRGFRKTRICGSSDGVTWFPLTSPVPIELPRASGTEGEPAFTIENAAGGRLIKSVIIAADAADGNYGSDYFGLSAVRFVAHREIAETPLR